MSIRSRSKKNLLFTTALLIVLAMPTYAADLPEGGQIVAGSGAINQSGNNMTITQDSAKMAANWNSFSVAQGHSVNFVQPSANAVALNRVLGSDVSLIQGSINANGQVFLINPNGVTFTPDAQVNVGGLVASTQNITTQDFLDGNYVFEGNSSNAIINQGNIKTPNGGTVALIAAKIINEGNIEAPSGNVLMGAGNKVTLDLGGPVKLEVEQGAIDTLIEQGGAVRADGGFIYLTAKAAGELATSVINHTGITEAQTLTTGEKGEIILLGDMDHGTLNVAGELNATAPAAGDGGFIETSAANVKIADNTKVSTKSETGENGTWLIDPNDFTVAASGGDITGATLGTNLGGGNVQIQTTGAAGDLYVNDTVSWAANKLTVTANDDIIINSDMTATGAASLAFEYGQDSADGADGTYTIANGVDVLIPSASNFTWKKGTGGAVNKLYFGNSYIKFDDNADPAINANGALLQPFYYDDGSSGRAQGWYKLTFSSYPLDFVLGTDGDGTNSWNYNGEVLTTNNDANGSTLTPAINSLSINIAGYNEGIGTLVSTTNVDVAETGGTADITHNYTLGANDNFIKTTTTVKNNSGATPLTNVRFWVGTRDDYVGQSDSNYKAKGNLGDGFVQITAQNTQAKAIKISEQTDGTGAAVLFYSISDGADTVTDSCCRFENSTDKDPRTSDMITAKADGSYALFLRMNDLAAGASESLVWYYAAGQASEIDTIIESVAVSAGVAPPPPPVDTTIPETSAVTTAQVVNNTPVVTPPPIVNTPSSAPTFEHSNGVGSMQIVEISGSAFDAQQGAASGGLSDGGADGGDNGGDEAGGDEAGGEMSLAGLGGQNSFSGPTRVFVVDGGIRLPSWAPTQRNNKETEKQ